METFGPFGEIITPPDTDQYEIAGAAPFAGEPLKTPPDTTPYEQPQTAGADATASKKEIPVSTQVFDDGSKIETFSDGATLTTDAEGNQEFRSAPTSPNANTVVTANTPPSEVAAKGAARSEASKQDIVNYTKSPDWRFRISLAPKANYFYNSPDPGILEPLKRTNGVLFPYASQVSVGYQASYEPTELTHTNYKYYTYKNSSVEQVSITADFTAQDTTEAAYVLAVIHFFRTVTKMFYGKDQNPVRGTPPSLVYLNGYGAYNFDNHPGVVTNFSFTYPNDVDYIATGTIPGGINTSQSKPKIDIPGLLSPAISRLFSSNIQPGGGPQPPVFQNSTQNIVKRLDETRIPTKLTMSITVLPIVTRYEISNNFSLKDYSTGKLMLGSQRGQGGGIW